MEEKTFGLVIFTLNEIEACRVIVPKSDTKSFRRVIFLDGGSTDGTVEWARENGFEVVLQREKGLRKGLFEAVHYLKDDVTHVLTISPDGNCDPATIPSVLEPFKNTDARIVIGSRYFGGGKSEDDDFITGFGNWLFTRMAQVLLGSKLTDVMVIYACWEISLLFELGIDEDESYQPWERMFFTQLGWCQLLSFRVAKYEIPFADVWVGEPPRIGGQRKLQIWRWGAATLGQLLRETWYTPKSLNRRKSMN